MQPSYRWGPGPFRLIPGAAQAIRRLNDAGLPVLVATNQTAVAYGFVTETIVAAVHAKMARLLATEAGAHVDGIYCNFWAPGGCVPRYSSDHPDPGDHPFAKPQPGMVL